MGKKMLLIMVALLLAAACATTQSAPTETPLPPTESPPTLMPEPTNTSIPPSQVPEPTNTSSPPTQLHPPIEVMLDENECTVAGPTELPEGDYSFIYINLTDRNSRLYVAEMLDGHTFQDVIDSQAGGMPTWLRRLPQITLPVRDLADNEKVVSWSLTPGEYAVYVYAFEPNPGKWFCTPLKIVRASSEESIQ